MRFSRYRKKRKSFNNEIDKKSFIENIFQKLSTKQTVGNLILQNVINIPKRLRPSPSRPAKFLGNQNFINFYEQKRQLKYIHDFLIALEMIDEHLENINLKIKTALLEVGIICMNNCNFENFTKMDKYLQKDGINFIKKHEIFVSISIEKLDRHIKLLEELLTGVIKVEDLSNMYYIVNNSIFDNSEKFFEKEKNE